MRGVRGPWRRLAAAVGLLLLRFQSGVLLVCTQQPQGANKRVHERKCEQIEFACPLSTGTAALSGLLQLLRD